MNQEHRWDDILLLPRPVSPKHPPMSPSARAAQFSPFAALTGYEEAVEETARLTEVYTEPDEDEKELLNRQLRLLCAHANEQPDVKITHFQPDEKKSGGAYLHAAGKILRVDSVRRYVYLTDGQRIPMEQICAMDSPLFEE